MFEHLSSIIAGRITERLADGHDVILREHPLVHLLDVIVDAGTRDEVLRTDDRRVVPE